VNVHVRPAGVRLALRDAAGATLDGRALDAWYVLAAGERAYAVELPAEACGRAAWVEVEVEAGAKPLRVSTALSPGACSAPTR
jgi:hypothetical protein